MIWFAFAWLAVLTLAHLFGMRNVHRVVDLLLRRTDSERRRVALLERRMVGGENPASDKDDRPFAHLIGRGP